MSRYHKTIENGDKTVAYGFDRATGYFFQVFDNIKSIEKDIDEPIIDECSLFTNMSNGKMVELMTQYEVDSNHIERVVLDLEF